MIAYVDESLRHSTDKRLYLVAAAVIVPGDLDSARDSVRNVLLPRQPRFHWRDESEPQRDRMLKIIEGVAPRGLIYSCRPAPRRQDRARSLCLASMLWDFRQIGVTEVVFESRESHNDRKDARTIGHAQRAQRGPDGLSYSFLRPLDEPLLWIADALAGASSSHIAGEEGRYLEALPGGLVQITEVAP